MSRESEAFRLINCIYAAASDEVQWATALDDFGRFFGAVGAVMHAIDDDFALLHVSGNLQEGGAAYNSYWYQEDPMISRVRDRGIRSGLVIDQRIVPRPVIQRGAFHQEFLASMEIGSISTILTNPAPGASVLFSLQNPIGKEPVSEADPIFMAVAQHFSRAAGLASTVRTLRTQRDTLLSSFGRFHCAAALVRADGAVVASNEKLRAAREGIILKRGHLATTSVGQQRRLDAFVAMSARVELGSLAPAALAIERPGNPLPLTVKAVPVTSEEVERRLDAPRENTVLVLIIDPAHRCDPEDHEILRLLGLTKAQARVSLLLGSGHAPDEIADTLSVKVSTIRATIKAIYAKLGISRQSELARIVGMVRPLA